MAATKAYGGGGRATPKRSTAKPKAKASSRSTSSAASKFSKAQKAAYARAYPTKSQRNKPRGQRSSNAPAKKPMTLKRRASGVDLNPFDAIGTLGQGLRDAFGNVAPQDMLFKGIGNRIRDVTRR